jgi:hypothetical protein
LATEEAYEDRMMRILLGIGSGWRTPFATEVVDFIREQAQMIVRLEAELSDLYEGRKMA